MHPRNERVCVFCGSRPGASPAYAEAARAMGETLAEAGLGLVYGGGRVGLMGVVAEAVLHNGGEVIGVIPQALARKEVAFTELEDLRVVASMHERKALMAELSDAFVALPGGLGTLEELFEVWTWGQLGIHAKPFGLLSPEGFYDPLVAWLDHLVEEGFVRPRHRAMLRVEQDPARLLAALREPVAAEPRWLDRDET